ncbi:MAG TPA: type II toxin-antitoxin system HicB family antitoxin [Gemmataceae bacterium]|nr:type II toxin-antitoxin system HicB family antitoxin [Gemmataceae bacterium]
MKRTNKATAKKHPPLRYLVFLRRTATGYSVDVPDLPGCVAAAGTLKTARRLIAEAIGLHLDLMQQSGEALPAPRQSIEFTVDETAEEELCTWVEVKDPILPPTKERATARAGSEKKP